MTETITQLQQRIGAINIANGWRSGPESADDHDEAFEAQVTRLGLAGTEASEAIEEVRNGHAVDETYYPGDKPKPEGAPSELADVVIRILDNADAWRLDLLRALHNEFGATADTLPGLLSEIGSLVRDSRGTFARGKEHPKAAITAITMLQIPLFQAADLLVNGDPSWGEIAFLLVEALLTALAIADAWGIDLVAIIDEKLSYNQQRGFRHGGKAA